jgi:hypothetical protein
VDDRRGRRDVIGAHCPLPRCTVDRRSKSSTHCSYIHQVALEKSTSGNQSSSLSSHRVTSVSRAFLIRPGDHRCSISRLGCAIQLSSSPRFAYLCARTISDCSRRNCEKCTNPEPSLAFLARSPSGLPCLRGGIRLIMERQLTKRTTACTTVRFHSVHPTTFLRRPEALHRLIVCMTLLLGD